MGRWVSCGQRHPQPEVLLGVEGHWEFPRKTLRHQPRCSEAWRKFERTAEQLRNGSIDVALGFDAAFSEVAEFKREQLAPLRTTFFVRKEHPLLAKEAVTAADLAQHHFISPSESRPYRALIRDIYESQGVDAQTRIHIVDFFPIAKRMVASSDAIGVIALPYTETDAFRRRFSVIPYLETFPLAPLCCAIRARWEPKPPIKAFLKACRETLAAGPDEAR